MLNVATAFMDMSLFLKDFVAGGVAATIGKSTVAPLERIKLILQVQDISRRIHPEKQYKGMVDAFVRIYREEGVTSLWRGNMASIYKYFPLQAFSFSFKELFTKYFVAETDKHKNFHRYVFLTIISGGLAGVTSVGIVYPLDYARTRLATDMGVSKREFTGIWDCLQKTFQHDGISGLYKGFVVSAQGFFIYRAIYFGLYDAAKNSLVEHHKKNLIFTFIVAQLTTIAAGVFSYPFDTVRRRMMMQAGLKKEDRIYKNTLHCWVDTFRRGGINAFFRGSMTNAVRATGGAITLILYDEIKEYLS